MSTVSTDNVAVGSVPVVATVASEGSEKKEKKTRNRAKGVIYAAPDDGFSGWEAATQGFDCDTHNKLKPTDFSDPLDFLLWEVWYFGERQKASQKKADQMLSLGKTKEERQARSKDAKVMSSFDTLVAKAASADADPVIKEALKAKLREMFEALNG